MTLLLGCGGADLVLPGDGEPAAIAIVHGGDQSGRVGLPLADPVVARVTDSQDRPVAGVGVALVFTGGGDATVVPDTATTGPDGLASFQVALGSRVGTARAEARVATRGPRVLVAALKFDVLSAAADRLVAVAGDSQSAPAGATLAEPLVVQVTDAFGNPIGGVSVEWSADAGSVSAETATTGSDGLASVERTLGGSAGVQHATATAPGLAGSPATFTQIASAGAAASLELVSGDGQSALVGTSVARPLVVRARDGAGNPVAGIAVAWVPGTGQGSLSPETSLTGEAGLTSTSWTLGQTPGPNSATAVISGVGTVGFTATANAGQPPALSFATEPPTAAVRGVSLSRAPVVQLRDPGGAVRRQAGVVVGVSLASGAGALRGPPARVTGPDGRVEFQELALEGPPGIITLAFGAAGYAGVRSGPIQLSRAGTAVTIFSDQPDPSVSGTPVRVRFRVQSAGGAPSGTVRVSSDDGTGCSASVATGECSLSPVGIGARTLTASYSGSTEFEGSTGVEAHTVQAPGPPPPSGPSGTASTLSVADASVGLGQRTQATVTVRDDGGTALKGVSVRLTASGSGNTIDPESGTSGPDGKVRFDFSSTEAGAKTLTAVAGGVTLLAQATVTVAQAATTTRITADEPDPSPPGAAFTVRFTVTSSAGVPAGDVTVALSGGGTCRATVSAGSCDLTPLAEGGQTLSATYAGTASFAGSSATEPHSVAMPAIALRRQPSPTAAPGVAFRQQPELELRGSDGKALQQSGVEVTASLASGTGTLTGTVVVTTDKRGRARFDDLGVAGPPGSYTIRFGADGFAPAISDPVELSQATQASIQSRVMVQPSSLPSRKRALRR